MPRGYIWQIYADDDGNGWLMKVDADYAADLARGWFDLGDFDLRYWPQGWRPREVEGLEPDGRSQRTRVGSVNAPLWTGAATTFTVNASDATPHDAVVFRYWSERKRPRAAGFP